jgi:hypothetical protein
LRLADLLTQSSVTLLAAQSQEAQLKSLPPGAGDAAHAYRARLTTLTGSAESKAMDSPGAAARPAAPRANLKELQGQIAGL